MKVLKYSAVFLLCLLVLVTISAYFYLTYLKKGALPDYNSTVIVQGIESEVIVYRDSFAIPHIYAKSETDLYMAVGFVMAQDRLFQMDLLRRVTLGRLAEIFGADLADHDLLMRALRITEKSEKLLSESDVKIVNALEAFSDGINYYIRNYPMPPEFKLLGYHPEFWEPIHSVNLIGYMAWDLTLPWETEVLLHQISRLVGDEMAFELVPDLINCHTVPVMHDKGYNIASKSILSAAKKLTDYGIEIFHGSNNWAVSGLKSETGKPILANDMHLGLNIPGIWYQMHQVVEGNLNVTGVVLPGQPFVIVGHNDSIAWGMTNVMVDDMDFYVETLNDDSTAFLFNQEWRALGVKKETIKVKGEPDIGKEIKYTHRGPIINRFKEFEEPVVSMRWIGNEWSNEILTVYKLNRANNWDDFREAVSTFIAVSQNVVYADIKGNIGIQTCAGIPIRKGNIYGFYPGETDEFDWSGIVPFNELPYEYNPARGYVSSANNKTVADDYPYPVSYWFSPPNRIERIREMLEEKDVLTVSDFQRMHTDTRSKLAEKILGHFVPYIEAVHNWNEIEKEALRLLKAWDYNLTLTSPEATIFELLYRKTIENIVRDDLDDELFGLFMGSKIMTENLLLNIISNPGSLWSDIKRTDETEQLDDIVRLSFGETITELSSLFGSDITGWQWGKLNSITLKHPMGSVGWLNKVFGLNRGPYPVPGSFHTVCPYNYPFGNPYQVNHGASQRHIYDLNEWDNSITVIPTGTSGIPSSPYYCDQTSLYVAGKYHRDLFSFGAVEAVAKYKTTIKGH